MDYEGRYDAQITHLKKLYEITGESTLKEYDESFGKYRENQLGQWFVNHIEPKIRSSHTQSFMKSTDGVLRSLHAGYIII